MEKGFEESVRKFSLQNAILHCGKADVGAVTGKVMAEHPQLRKEAREVMPAIKTIVDEVNRMSVAEQRKLLESLAPELLVREKREKEHVLPPLPNPGDDVVMRLAPFPSGPLHIGNARMVLLNDEYVKTYGGRLLLIFDDTMGSDYKPPVPESYELIESALEWLDVDVHEVHYKSDRLPIFYEWAEKLIVMGHAYVCHCDSQVLRKNREEGKECEHRKFSVEQNLDRWRLMLLKRFDEGEAVLRLKTDMKHRNPAFRDRVLFRISAREHPRAGNKYAVWPLLEFSWAVDDHLLGVTHILRGKDLIIEDEMERFLWKLFNVKGGEFIHYGMLRIKEMKLSKSKSRTEVMSKVYSGWDDPRTWSIQSLAKRGIKAEAVREFILSFGLSLTDIEVPAENLYSENRKLIDSEADRFFFVPNPKEIVIEGLPPGLRAVEMPNHPTLKERGKRTMKVSSNVCISKEDFENLKGKEVRLKDFCNIIMSEKAKFTSRENKDISKIQWVSEGIKTRVVMPDGNVVEGVGEVNLRHAERGGIVQFERFGFVRLDKVENEVVAYFGHK